MDGKRLKFLRNVLGARIWRLHRAYIPLRLQPLHGGLHGAQAQRAEAAQDGGERGRREGEPRRLSEPQKKDPELSFSRFLAFSIMISRSAAAAQDDFLSGLPMRAGMASGEARRVGGRGRSLPCGCSDAQRPPYERPREDALLEAERSRQRHLIAQLDEELLDETLCRSCETTKISAGCWSARTSTSGKPASERCGRSSALRSWSAATSAGGWSASTRSSSDDELEDALKKIPSSRFLAFSIMLIRSAAAAQDDFLGGLPLRAGMASGEARRVGGRGRSLPCGCSDGPAASLQAASRGRAARGRALAPERPHRAPRLGAPRRNSALWGAGLREQKSPLAAGPPPRDHRARARASGEGGSIDILRWRLERRVEVLKEENEDLRERAVLAEVRVDELEEDLDRARGAR